MIEITDALIAKVELLSYPVDTDRELWYYLYRKNCMPYSWDSFRKHLYNYRKHAQEDSPAYIEEDNKLVQRRRFFEACLNVDYNNKMRYKENLIETSFNDTKGDFMLKTYNTFYGTKDKSDIVVNTSIDQSTNIGVESLDGLSDDELLNIIREESRKQ